MDKFCFVFFDKNNQLYQTMNENKHLNVKFVQGKNNFIAWLNYIISNYDDLNQYTMFLREDPLKYTKFQTYEEFYQKLNTNICIFVDKTQWLITIKCNGNGYPHHPNLPIDHVFKEVFNANKVPEVYEFIYGGQIVLTKKQILSHPISFYTNLKDNIDEYTLERIWSYI